LFPDLFLEADRKFVTIWHVFFRTGQRYAFEGPGAKNRGGGVHIGIKHPQNFPNFPDEHGITCGATMHLIRIFTRSRKITASRGNQSFLA
jgi:hypothetical protein